MTPNANPIWVDVYGTVHAVAVQVSNYVCRFETEGFGVGVDCILSEPEQGYSTALFSVGMLSVGAHQAWAP